jgi:hypothetical protein
MGALNDIQIRHWIKAAAPVAKSDGDGLTFTLSAAGTASWCCATVMVASSARRQLAIPRYFA